VSSAAEDLGFVWRVLARAGFRCPTCGALLGEPCKTAVGRPFKKMTSVHPTRLKAAVRPTQ